MKKFFRDLAEKFLTGLCNFVEFAKENLCRLSLFGIVFITSLVISYSTAFIYGAKSVEYYLMVAISGEEVESEDLNRTAEVFKEAIDGDTPEKRLNALVELKSGGYFKMFLREKEEMLSLMRHEKTIADVMQKPNENIVLIILFVCLILRIGIFPIGSFIKLQSEGHFGYTTVKEVFLDFPWKKWWFWPISIYWLLGYWPLFFIWFLIRIKTDKEIVQKRKK